VQYQGYTTNFVRVLDFETLALQEDFRLGHNVILRLYPSSSDVVSSRTLLGVFAAAQYTVPVSDGLVRVGAESQTEIESRKLADARITGFWHLVSPRLGFGRLVHNSRLDYQYRNYLNRRMMLGGNGRLRGYPSNYDEGSSLITSNLELRTRPVEVLSLQLGGAAFYDVGDAFDRIESLRIKQAVGFGIRALFPQLDRYVFRTDVGFPVARGPLPADVAAWSFYVSFEQALAVPNVEPF
jgi:hypothetical protein